MTNHPEFLDYPGNAPLVAGKQGEYLLPSAEPVQLITPEGAARTGA